VGTKTAIWLIAQPAPSTLNSSNIRCNPVGLKACHNQTANTTSNADNAVRTKQN